MTEKRVPSGGLPLESEDEAMRMMMKVTLPVETANEKIRTGQMGQVMESILEDLKPEAAYFTEMDGERTGIIFFHMTDPSQIPLYAEPWFLAFNAKVEFKPAMVLEDFKKAAQSLPEVVRKYDSRTPARV